MPLWNFYTNDIDDDFDGDNKVGSVSVAHIDPSVRHCYSILHTYVRMHALRVTMQSASHLYKTFNQIHKTHNFRIKMKRFSKYTRCDLNL